MKKVFVISSASGSGKTTVGRELASRLGVPFLELDALVHGPNWTTTPDGDIRRMLEPTLTSDAWVIDGSCSRAYADSVLAGSDIVVWLDLPRRIWLPRLIARTVRRVVLRETLWNGNRETLQGAVWGRDALIPHAWRTFSDRRRRYPVELERYAVVRLESTADVRRLLASSPAQAGRDSG